MNIEFPFKDPDFLKAWEEWEQYRKERKIARYVPTGLKKTFTHLKNISGDDKNTAIKIIHQSMEQNYAGLFPLKHQNGSHQSTSASKPGTSEARLAAAKDF